MLRDFALGPVYLAQALAFLARVARLPEAAGPRAGESGQGPPLRLLILGDSSAAGVGVSELDAALSGHLLAHLGADHRVVWHLKARSGITTAQARQMLDDPAQRWDVAVLALGVNDVLRQTSPARFAREQAALQLVLRESHGVARVLVSAVPPLGAFEVFPEPLRSYLGRRASALDARLRQVCRDTGAQHVPFDLQPSQHWLASDGLHPGAALYAEWGKRMAGLASDRLS